MSCCFSRRDSRASIGSGAAGISKHIGCPTHIDRNLMPAPLPFKQIVLYVNIEFNYHINSSHGEFILVSIFVL